jgi:phage terminase large subunit-like protein
MKESDGENLWQVLETATGARRSPLLIAITTAGTNKQSACFKMYEYAKRVRDGVINDPAFLPVIFEADPEDDITKESTWKKANPCYGVSLKRAYMEREALKAQTMPSYENLYRRLHLNQWVTSETRWLNDSDWCGNSETVSEELLKKSPCWGGLDLASVRDLTSFCLVWDIDGLLVVKHWTFIPEEKAYARKGKGDGVNYLEWSEILEITGGNVTDYNFVKAKILQLAEVYKIKSIAFDRWNASQLVIELTDKGLNMSPFGMGYKSLSPPTKHIEAKVLEGQIVHFGCPVLRWQISNVQVATDPAGNIKPAKDKSTDKIDTVMAMIMATGEMIYTEKETQSVYQDRRGFLTL